MFVPVGAALLVVEPGGVEELVLDGGGAGAALAQVERLGPLPLVADQRVADGAELSSKTTQESSWACRAARTFLTMEATQAGTSGENSKGMVLFVQR